MLMNWAAWLKETALSQYIQQDATTFPLLEVTHVMAVALVVGSVFIVDLRLMNLASKSYRVSRLMSTVLPMTVVAFLFALASGFLMFASQPVVYLKTVPFVLKMGLLVLAGLNMFAFHFWTQRTIANWDEGEVIPSSARAAGLISLVLWIAILFAGRFVGFMLAY